MRVRLPFVPAAVLAAGLVASAALAQTPDAKAVAVADRVMEALGGSKAWNDTRYLRFDFAVERDGKSVMRRAAHLGQVDRPLPPGGGHARGRPVCRAVEHQRRARRARLVGKDVELTGAAAKKQLEQAYAAWVNDTYWLLMPYKLRDPGVVLALDGEEKKGGEAWDKLRLSFDNVGLTPKDKYWVYVNRKTGLVDRWDYVLKGESKPPTSFAWLNWKKHGRVMLADDRRSSADGMRIYFPVLDAPESMPDAVFTAP